MRAVRALSVAAGTQQPAARPVSLLSSYSASSPVFLSSAPNPLRPPLKVSLAETPGRSSWSQDATVEGDPRRGSTACRHLLRTEPARAQVLLLGGSRGEGCSGERQKKPRLLTEYTAWLPNAFVGSQKKIGSAAKLPEQEQGRFPLPPRLSLSPSQQA